MSAKEILDKYIQFFEKKGHVRIENSSLVPLNDPTTLFTSSGMQPLVPFLLGEKHPSGTRLVNSQNSFRAQDIDEIGDNRHTTFFRMLGNWSLGDYFKKEQLPWIFEFLTSQNEGLGLPAEKLYVTVFEGGDGVGKDTECIEIWRKLFEEKGIKATVGERIFEYSVEKNWWSRSGIPSNMPVGEPGGPDSEIFYDFGSELGLHGKSEWKEEECHVNCDCGRFTEIGNSVFMQYLKEKDGTLSPLPKPNVDFGGGLERMLMAVERKQDVFTTSLFSPIISSIEKTTDKKYKGNEREMRIITDHFLAAIFISSNGVTPSNKEQGYVLRRLIRRGLDNFYLLEGKDLTSILTSIVSQYKDTDPVLTEKFDHIKNLILEEETSYQKALQRGAPILTKKLGDIKWSEGIKKLEKLKKEQDNQPWILLGRDAASIAFDLFQSNGIPIDYFLDKFYEEHKIALAWGMDDIIREEFEKLRQTHSQQSRTASTGMFKGGLADSTELTVKGHTATHLMHQALRDILGNSARQTGSNITPERVRFDFTYDRKLTDEELKKVRDIVLTKIKEDLPVHFEIMSLQKARDLGAIGLFNDKYSEDVKIYFIGGSNEKIVPRNGENAKAYSVEFCGGPHVEHTGTIESFAILKEEGIARGVRRIYAKVS